MLVLDMTVLIVLIVMAVFTTDLTCLFCSYMTPGSVCLSTCAPLCFHGVAVVALFLTWSSCCVAVVLGCAPPHTSLFCLSRWWCLCFITHFLALLSLLPLPSSVSWLSGPRCPSSSSGLCLCVFGTRDHSQGSEPSETVLTAWAGWEKGGL